MARDAQDQSGLSNNSGKNLVMFQNKCCSDALCALEESNLRNAGDRLDEAGEFAIFRCGITKQKPVGFIP